MLKLYSHQLNLINIDPKKCLIAWGTGVGKTITTLLLAEGTTLVITQKTIRDDLTWEKNFKKLDNSKITKLKVISKEDARRDLHMYPHYDTLILDESHQICSISPQLIRKNGKSVQKTSQIFSAVHNYIKVQKPTRLYMLTATPIRNPLSVLAHAWLLGKEWDFLKFRETFYFRLPMHGREIWSPKVTTVLKERLGKAVQGLGFTGRLEDFIDVPEQTFVERHVPLTASQISRIKQIRLDYPDPIVRVGKQHQVEGGTLKGDRFNESEVFDTGKLEALEYLHVEYPKLLIFCKYTEQIELIANHFRKLKVTVLTLNGSTKNRLELITQAESLSNCIVVAQTSISAGYELPSYRCTVYYNESYSTVDAQQSLGRTLRINNPQKNLYVYLLSGDVDKGVRKALAIKEDFNEKIYAGKI